MSDSYDESYFETLLDSPDVADAAVLGPVERRAELERLKAAGGIRGQLASELLVDIAEREQREAADDLLERQKAGELSGPELLDSIREFERRRLAAVDVAYLAGVEALLKSQGYSEDTIRQHVDVERANQVALSEYMATSDFLLESEMYRAVQLGKYQNDRALEVAQEMTRPSWEEAVAEAEAGNRAFAANLVAASVGDEV